MKIWICLVTLALAACSLPGTQPVTVTFAVHGEPAEQDAFAAVVDAYHQTEPTVDGRPVQVELSALPNKSDYLARLATDFAAGSPPDVFLLNYRRLAQYHNPGALEPLGPRVARSTELSESDFFEVALNAFRSADGTVVCLPQNISSQVVYLNLDLFERAGIALPDNDWTWETFREIAGQLTLPDEDGDGEPDQYGLGLEPHLIRVAPFIWQNRGELVDDPQAPSRFVLDTPEAREAIQFVLDLSQVEGVVPNRTAEAVQSHRERFYGGQIGMYVDSRRIVPTMREIAEFAWDVAPLPRGKEAASILHSDGYCLAHGSEVADAAWDFIEFALSAAGQEPASRLGRTVPSLRTVAESELFLDPSQSPASARVWLDAIPTLRVLPRVENWARIERTAAVELEQAYLGERTVDVVISAILSEAELGFVPLR